MSDLTHPNERGESDSQTSATTAAGRDQCPNCGSFATERIRSEHSGTYHTNTKENQCKDCGEEWKEYTGEPCEQCGSKNTRDRTKGATPHRKKVRECRECNNTEFLRSMM